MTYPLRTGVGIPPLPSVNNLNNFLPTPLETVSVSNPWQSNPKQNFIDWDDMTALDKVFSVLSVGQYVSANIAKSLIDGDGNVLRAAWNGITMKERNSFVDILKEHNVKWAPLLGTVLDIGLDPFTWLPGPVQMFKLATKGTSVEKALIKASQFLDEIEPVKRIKNIFGKAFDPKFGVNHEVFDVIQMEKAGMRQEHLALMREWNDFAKTIPADVRKNLYKWRVHAPSRPADYAKYDAVMSKFDDLTQRAVSSGFITPEVVKKHLAEDGTSNYLPIITLGWLKDGWLPGRSIIGPTKMPGFAYKRSMKYFEKHPEEFPEMMRQVADTFADMSKVGTVDDMRKIAQNTSGMMNDAHPFKAEFMETVEDIFTSNDMNVKKIKKSMQNHSVYYTPVDDFFDLGKIYEANLVQYEHQKRVADFIFSSPESKAGGWVQPLTSQLPISHQRFIVRRKDAEAISKQLGQSKLPKKIKVDPTKMKVGDILSMDGQNYAWRVTKLNEDGSFNYKAIVTSPSIGNRVRKGTIVPGLSYDEAQRTAGQFGYVAREKMITPSRTKKASTELSKFSGTTTPLFMDYIELDKASALSLMRTMETMGVPNTVVHAMDPEVAAGLTRAKKAFSIDTGPQNELLKFYDKTLGHWARWATVMRWPFHVRNFLSNTSLAFLSGVEPWELPVDGLKAALIQKGSKESITIGKLTKTGDEWLKLIDSYGVRSASFIRSIVPESTVDEILSLYSGGKRGKWIGAQAINKAYEIGHTIGAAVEDNARIMTFINRFAKNGGDVKEATTHVWKYMFQYDQLTDFESGFMKRVIPFYTWMRKNLPLQISETLQHPGRMGAQMKVYNAFALANPDTPAEKQFKPDYMNDFTYFKVPEFAKKAMEKIVGKPMKDSIYVHLDLPWMELKDLKFENAVQRIVSGLSPAITLPLGLATNTKNFPELGEPIKKFTGELKPAPWPATLLPQGMWAMFGIQPMRDSKTGKMIAGMPADSVQTLFTLVPSLYELTKLFPDKKATFEVEDAPWRRLRYLTGINFTPVNRQEEQYYWVIERENRLGEAARIMEQQGRAMTGEELKEFLDHGELG